MFAVIQKVICTLYLFVYLLEAVTKNGPAPCFLQKTHERIRVNREITEPIITKSLNSQEKSQKSIIDSVLSISNPENFQTEKNKKENESSKTNLTDSAQIIMDSLNFEITKNDEGNSKEKESLIASNSSNIESPRRDEKNTTDEESSIVTKALNSESTKTEEEKLIVKEAVFFNKSLDYETTKEEGNFPEKDSLNKSIKDSVQIVKNPLKLEQRNEANSKEKESGNENVTESSPILTKSLNSENTKIEKRNVREKESELKNRSVSLQKSIIKGKKSKIRRETNGSNLTEKEKTKVDRVFLRAYENCKLLRDNHFLRVAGSNLKETKDCVVKELRKSEKYPGEFVKYLDNKEIIRRA